MTMSVRPAATASIASRIMRSFRPSSEDVDSSSSRIGGAASRARAIARRCRSPPESMMPFSPTCGVEPGGSRSSTAAEVHGVQHVHALGVGRVGAAELEVVADRAGEHRRVLLDVADLRAELGALERADVEPAHAHGADARVVEPLDEREDRGLAGAGRPDERDPLPARHAEGHAPQHGLALGDVGLGQVLVGGVVGGSAGSEGA